MDLQQQDIIDSIVRNNQALTCVAHLLEVADRSRDEPVLGYLSSLLWILSEDCKEKLEELE
ncbi:hypothetical protein [Phocoenobacter skyensis]|uniref:Uncharacterized protein n=1 Tax=Phocoenobacter skyensis TaxID=97481 RepID=A0ABT9JKS3_9PAST|nr:hypothetical protein [Pasteurella skyensis]MDP8079534.1 hypothetical protein [Pasteurella skyensis]MDP8085406.1 hypothetical protein [Pasteurella skyensis]